MLNLSVQKGPSPLKYQTRAIARFKEANGYAIGSIEGRVGIQYVEEKDTSYALALFALTCRLNFSFKCHRDDKTIANVYPVNAISIHPVYGTFSTAGGDGACTHPSHCLTSF